MTISVRRIRSPPTSPFQRGGTMKHEHHMSDGTEHSSTHDRCSPFLKEGADAAFRLPLSHVVEGTRRRRRLPQRSERVPLPPPPPPVASLAARSILSDDDDEDDVSFSTTSTASTFYNSPFAIRSPVSSSKQERDIVFGEETATSLSNNSVFRLTARFDDSLDSSSIPLFTTTATTSPHIMFEESCTSSLDLEDCQANIFQPSLQTGSDEGEDDDDDEASRMMSLKRSKPIFDSDDEEDCNYDVCSPQEDDYWGRSLPWAKRARTISSLEEEEQEVPSSTFSAFGMLREGDEEATAAHGKP